MIDSLDTWLLWAHIVAAAVWLGGGTMLVVESIRARRSGDEASFIGYMEWAGPRVGPPVSLVLAVTGVWMVLRSSAWSFTEFWIAIGIGVFVLLLGIGIGFHARQYARINEAKAQLGPDAPETKRLIHQSFTAAEIEVALLVVVVLVMVAKP